MNHSEQWDDKFYQLLKGEFFVHLVLNFLSFNVTLVFHFLTTVTILCRYAKQHWHLKGALFAS